MDLDCNISLVGMHMYQGSHKKWEASLNVTDGTVPLMNKTQCYVKSSSSEQ